MKKTYSLYQLGALLLCLSLLACDKKKEEELKDALGENTQVEVPTTTTTSTTIPGTTTTTMPPSTGVDLFKDVVPVIGDAVDKIYPEYKELLVQRGGGYVHATDSCDFNDKGQGSFAGQIAYFVNKNMTSRKAQLDLIAGSYDIPADSNKLNPTSLISHSMCEVTADSLKKTIGASRVPSAKVVAQANNFAKKYNSLRQKMKSGDALANLEMNRLWSRLNMCLAYVEALTSADTASSENLAQKYAPSDYRRPAGVLFYENSKQSDVSGLNIGLFQFSPVSGGNIHTCINQWNKIYPACRIASGGTSAEMIRLLGSSYQAFNVYCGTEKPTETFAVQVNTSSSRRTHPQNLLPDGSLKAPTDRCVTLHFQAGVAYNHFGPFQNTTGNNLEELLSCTMAE